MKPTTLFAAALILAGCGGALPTSPLAATQQGSLTGMSSPEQTYLASYVASYAGTFTNATTGESGTMTVALAPNGLMTGTWVNTGDTDTGSIRGLCNWDGSASWSVTYGVRPQMSYAGTFALTGSTLAATCQEWSAGNPAAVSNVAVSATKG